MLSQTVEYALRAVVWLAQNADDGPCECRRIAAGTKVPVTYLAKVLQSLCRADIVTSRRGIGGGFSLNRATRELTVLEVVNAVDPIRRIEGCPLGLKTHARQLCPMHARLDAAYQMVEKVFASTTIEEVLSDSTRPVPLVELCRWPK